MQKDETYGEYIKAYNQAYIIQKHMPDLAKEIAEALKEDTLWADGFKDGREQMIEELDKARPEILRRDRLDAFRENKDKSIGREKDEP